MLFSFDMGAWPVLWRVTPCRIQSHSTSYLEIHVHQNLNPVVLLVLNDIT